MASNLVDPMIYLFELGFGPGLLVGRVDGVSYIIFLAAGTVTSNTMMSASFGAVYFAFSRIHVQRTWEAILYAPLSLDDVVPDKPFWAASKSAFPGLATILVVGALSYALVPQALLALPIIVLAGFTFACLVMNVTAPAPNYDFFMFYQALVTTSMILLSGMFFLLSQSPMPMCAATSILPLPHAVGLTCPLILGRILDNIPLHLGTLLLYAVNALLLCLWLLRRCTLKRGAIATLLSPAIG